MTRIVIYGRGKTGQSCQKLLKKQGVEYVVYDDLVGFQAPCLFDKDTVVIVSPGVSPNAKGIVEAKSAGSKIVGELEYCFPLCKAPCVSVTGTNGKTTTCQLINHILQYCKKTTRLLGNGGVPFSQEVLSCKEEDIVVLESSSFQLVYCNTFAPRVSLFTNLADDHLDYHCSFENYSLAKQNNFLRQRKNDYAIFNADDPNVMALARKSKCHTLFYSTKNPNANCYFDGKNVVVNLFGKVQKAPCAYLENLFEHNRSNCLGALLCCMTFGVGLLQVVESIYSCEFLPHRTQVITTVKGVTFVDDSKGTNVHATVTAIKCFKENLALILGGSNKGYDFDEIFCNVTANVKVVCATGQTAHRIATCGNKHGVEVVILEDIKQCVRFCFERLLPIGGVVLMSNACASFDKFSGYDERGRYFQQAVEEIAIENKV